MRVALLVVHPSTTLPLAHNQTPRIVTLPRTDGSCSSLSHVRVVIAPFGQLLSSRFFSMTKLQLVTELEVYFLRNLLEVVSGSSIA